MINQRDSFRFFKLCEVPDGAYIIDSVDSKVEKVSKEFINQLLDCDIVLNDFKDYPIGISINENEYVVDVLGKNDIFNSKFPTEFEGKKLYNHIITAPNGAVVTHGHIIIEVICKCWVELKYEIPVSITHYVAFPLDNDLSDSFMMAYMSRPIHVCHSVEEFNQLKIDFGDLLPENFCILIDNLVVDLENLKVLGVDLFKNELVHDFDLSSHMHFM